MEYKHIYLKSFCVKGVYGLDADVDFDREWTNLYGMNCGGRTRFLRCLEAARVIACTRWDDLPSIIEGKAKAGDSMTLSVCVDDYNVTLTLDFSEAESVWGGTFVMVTRSWRFYDRVGDDNMQLIVYGDDGDAEKMAVVDELQDELMLAVMKFLRDKLVLNIDDAMCHLSGLPYEVLGVIGVHGKEDISENIGKLMPWLCIFSDESDITMVMDDVFDNIHTLVVDNLVNTYRGYGYDEDGKQIVMSCRKPRAMMDNKPCYFFRDGKAVVISRRDVYSSGHVTNVRYRFEREGEEHPHYWSVWLEYLEKGEDMRVLDDVKAYLKSLDGGESDGIER